MSPFRWEPGTEGDKSTMEQFTGRTAVITGAAGGIGLALARRAAAEGMRLVLADIDGERLEKAAATLALPGERLHLCAIDVSREEDIARLAGEAFGRFGAVHLLCNNAGVALAREAWQHSAADWQWVLGVNLWSVVHAVNRFVPRLLQQADESHIVNTASAAGLLSTPGMAAYNVSKHGVVTLSETLYTELAMQNARVGVSVLCPAWVPTDIHLSQRARPPRFGAATPPSEAAAAYEARIAKAIHSGRLSADDMADAVFAAMAEKRFYVIPHAKIMNAVRLRMEDILHSRNPTPLG